MRRARRSWLKLVYDFPGFKGTRVARLQACRRFKTVAAQRRECRWRPLLACRWRYTQFNGGFGVDFVNAPKRGLCAELVVRVRGRAEPLRRYLFHPPPD